MNRLRKNSLRNVFLLSCAALALAARSFDIEFKSFRSEANKNITETFTIGIIEVDKRQIFNGSIIFAIDIDQFELNLVLSIIRKNGQNRKMVDITVDGCNLLANGPSQGNHLGGLFIKLIRNFSQNLPSSCPIKKGFEIVVNKFYLDPGMFPPYLPVTDFEAQLIMKHNKVFGYKLKILGAIISKEEKKLLTKPL